MNLSHERLLELLWHPHQGLWNLDLLKAIRRIIPLSPINKLIDQTIIFMDTIVLFLRTLVRKVSLLGFTKIVSKARVPNEISILYFDLGTHMEAAELTLMVDRILPSMSERFEAYGFEATQEFFEQANAKFAGRKNVNLIHKALCYVLPSDGKIKLYKSKGKGLGNSLYRSSDTFEEVEAIRFSDWLRNRNIDLENSICLLRMNIEGAEYDVLQDLVSSGLAKYIDGYYGMWDDVYKLDKQRDDQFRAFLRENQLYPFTFNGRDLKYSARIRCIEYDINTSVQVKLHKLKERLKKIKKVSKD